MSTIADINVYRKTTVPGKHIPKNLNQIGVRRVSTPG